MEMKIESVGVFVSNFGKAVQWYRDALGLRPRMVDEQNGYAEFETEGCALAIYQPPEDHPEQQRVRSRIGLYTGIAFRSNDIEADYKLLQQRGVIFTRPPEEKSWGKIAVFLDPDGNGFYLISDRSWGQP